MRRRSSGSTEEDDTDERAAIDSLLPGDDGRKRSFTSSKFDLTRHSDTLDRRKVEKSLSPTPLTQPAWSPEPETYGESETQERPLGPAASDTVTRKMHDPRDRWRSRMRSPWRASLLTLTVTAASILFLFTLVRSLVTRQLDPKGCSMSFMAPMYAKLSGFDTEHTRFASKYSLYLYREGGVDEDTMVRQLASLH